MAKSASPALFLESSTQNPSIKHQLTRKSQPHTHHEKTRLPSHAQVYPVNHAAFLGFGPKNDQPIFVWKKFRAIFYGDPTSLQLNAGTALAARRMCGATGAI
jgi:hypothetical protein